MIRMKSKLVKGVKKSGIILLPVIIIALLTFSIALAALYNIDTTEGSVAEWTSQEIPLFLTDPLGDPLSGRADEDILETWVASADEEPQPTPDGVVDHLYFLMKVAGSPALNLANRAAVAALDCDNNGSLIDFEDRLIIYRVDTDYLIVRHGNQEGDAWSDPGTPLGQRVGEYLEWGVATNILTSMPDQTTPADYCQGVQNIGFATSTAPDSFSEPGVTIDETDNYRGFNIPTAIELFALNASSESNQSQLPLLISVPLIVVGLLLSILFFIKRRHSI